MYSVLVGSRLPGGRDKSVPTDVLFLGGPLEATL